MRILIVLIMLLVSNVCEAKITLVLFRNLTTCGHCRKMEPAVRKAKNAGVDIKVVDTETSKGSKMADQFKVNSIPTILVMDTDKQTLKRVKGEQTFAQLVTLSKPIKSQEK